MINLTVAIIKPDILKKKKVSAILKIIADNGYQIFYMQKLTMTKTEAEDFYTEHRDKPFYGELIDFMTSGPCIFLILNKFNAIKDWRKLMREIRAEYGGATPCANAVHGSDSEEGFYRELGFLFTNPRYSE
jgi:nucleoside-diphosphate kinase